MAESHSHHTTQRREGPAAASLRLSQHPFKQETHAEAGKPGPVSPNDPLPCAPVSGALLNVSINSFARKRSSSVCSDPPTLLPTGRSHELQQQIQIKRQVQQRGRQHPVQHPAPAGRYVRVMHPDEPLRFGSTNWSSLKDRMPAPRFTREHNLQPDSLAAQCVERNPSIQK
eukprot:1161898-Pelagomonas_calceolata.AAC.4